METTLKLKPVVLSVCALTLVIGCSGGGGGGVEQDATAFLDAASVDASTVTALSLNANEATVTSESGTLDRDGDTLTFGDTTGTLSDDRTSVDLEDGAITFEGDADAFAVRFDAAEGATNTIGIIGVATDAGSLPSGSATYAGDTVITAQSGTDLFELTGTAAITADFDAATPSVTTALTGLSGTRQPAAAAAEDVADAGSLTIAGSEISGNGFNGGTATLESTVLTLSGDESTALEGAFYGPDADEVGGVFIIEDGETRIFGDFLGD